MRRACSIAVIVIALSIGFALVSRQAKSIRLHSGGTSASRPPLSQMPHVILWAWERPANLNFLNPNETGIAFLAKTLSLRGERLVVRPRLQPLSFPPGTKLIAVARIESDRSHSASLSTSHLQMVTAEISELASLPGVAAIQIDFDAVRSEREFYRSLLVALRRELPPEMPLSITALASWCLNDDWLSDLPIDEAVPMLFRMGIERRHILSQLEAGMRFNAMPCRRSAGVSTDEPIGPWLEGQRLYIFSDQEWSPVSFNKAMEIYQR